MSKRDFISLHDLTAGQVAVDFYLASSLTESGEYSEQRSEIFSFAVPGRSEEAARVSLEVA